MKAFGKGIQGIASMSSHGWAAVDSLTVEAKKGRVSRL